MTTTSSSSTGGAPPLLRFAIPEPSRWRLRIERVEPSTPAVRRLTASLSPVDGEPTGVLAYAPGQDLSLSLPGPGGPMINRRYTISAYEPATSTIELTIVAHGDGPGARFLDAARPGDEIDAFGPRGKITLVATSTSHLFVGDESSLAAIASMVAALEPGEQALVFGDVADASEHREMATVAGAGLDLRYVDRFGGAPESPDRLLAAIGAIELDPDRTHAYVFGEFHVVRAVRGELLGRLGAERISPKPYWRAGQPNAGHGEPPKDG